MTIKILKPGIYSTVQDLGRFGYARFGVNRNGPMDPLAARIANLIVGNEQRAAFLELHFPAAELRFETDAIFSVCGADFSPILGGAKIENWHPYFADAGSRLFFAEKKSGNRAYIAIRGGFKGDLWLGSASTNLAVGEGGFQGRRLKAGDLLETASPQKLPTRAPAFFASPSLIPRYSRFPTVRITRGGEFEKLAVGSREWLFSENFSVTNGSDRMGFRLRGRRLDLIDNRAMLSSAVDFGTVQLLPDGQTIILMADHQTTGGYPRIGHVIPPDLPLVGQLGAGDGIGFHEVTFAAAERATIDLEADVAKLATACRLFYGRNQ